MISLKAASFLRHILLAHLVLMLRTLQLVAHVVLYTVHLAAHALSVFVDPADPNLRMKDSKRPVPKFNRSEHAHVIENGHCHLCDIDISSQVCAMRSACTLFKLCEMLRMAKFAMKRA